MGEYEISRENAIKQAQLFIMSNLADISRILIEEEDGKYEGTMTDLKSAINSARLEDLQKFPKTRRIPYEGHSYVSVVFKKQKKQNLFNI